MKKMKAFTITRRAGFVGASKEELAGDVIKLLWECEHTFAELAGELNLKKANEKALKLVLLELLDVGLICEVHSPDEEVVYFITKKGINFFEKKASRMGVLEYTKNPQRTKLIKEFGLRKGMSVLDVGCGNGAGTFPLLRFVGPTGKVTGIDYNAYELSYAQKIKRLFNVRNAKFVQTNVLKPKLKEHFDAAVSFGVLRYVSPEYLKKFVENMKKLCKSGGIVAVAEANPVPRNKAEQLYLEFAIGGKTGNYYPLKRIKRVFRECGLKLIKARVVPNSCLIDAPGSCILADMQHYLRKGKRDLAELQKFEKFEKRYGSRLRRLGCKEPDCFVVVGRRS